MVGKVSLEKLSEWSKLDGVGIILAPNASLVPQQDVKTKKELSLV
jgi:hypothetical protein